MQSSFETSPSTAPQWKDDISNQTMVYYFSSKLQLLWEGVLLLNFPFERIYTRQAFF